ncbi:AAA family ATPase [Pseudoalteromonas xiamenensis]
MKLTFKSQHLSIKAFPDIEIPPFTLITGVNGAGKTHLLRAINLGNIQNSLASRPQQETKFFDSSTLVPNDIGQVSTAHVYQQRDSILQVSEQYKNSQVQNLTNLMNQFRIADKWD